MISLNGKKICLNVQVQIYTKLFHFLTNKEDPVVPAPGKQLKNLGGAFDFVKSLRT